MQVYCNLALAKMNSMTSVTTKGYCLSLFLKAGEEITNANPIDTNANVKSPNIYMLWSLVPEQSNGKKRIIIYKNRSLPFHVDQF